MPLIDKILSSEKASRTTEEWKKANMKIVFTNGCFDILHLGHVSYLEAAKTMGDKLVVGVNSDKSIRRLKGKDRPITDQTARSGIIAALEAVDVVVIFEEDDPLALVKAILPDVLVKGDDYLTENIIGADIVIENGGEVRTIGFVEGYSTSKLIRKIKKLNSK